MLRYTLDRDVDAVAYTGQLIMQPVSEPLLDELRVQPLPPAQLQQLFDIGLVDRDPHRRRAKERKEAHLIEKGVPVAPLERIEEIAVPDVEANGESDLQ